eukprot:2753007-Amphidinium_carterae.1
MLGKFRINSIPQEDLICKVWFPSLFNRKMWHCAPSCSFAIWWSMGLCFLLVLGILLVMTIVIVEHVYGKAGMSIVPPPPPWTAAGPNTRPSMEQWVSQTARLSRTRNCANESVTHVRFRFRLVLALLFKQQTRLSFACWDVYKSLMFTCRQNKGLHT